MKKIKYMNFLLIFIFCNIITPAQSAEYKVGSGDILTITVLQPDQFLSNATVSPSGEISVPYIGNISVKGKTINKIRLTIQNKLANGYFKYPVVTVSLVESRSRNFTISGEIERPGNYPLKNDTTILTAISLAGGFTKFSSKSNVKILRRQSRKAGYKSIKVNIQDIIDGKPETDVLIKPGDIIIVSESFF